MLYFGMRKLASTLLLIASLSGCVTYTTSPSNPAKVAAIRTIALVPARAPETLLLVPVAPTGEGGNRGADSTLVPVPAERRAKELTAAAVAGLYAGAVIRWRASSAELTARLPPADSGVAGAWNESLARALRARGFTVVVLSAQSAPSWPRGCPHPQGDVDAVLGVELFAGFVGSENLKPLVEAGVRVVSKDCRDTLASPVYLYGPGSTDKSREQPDSFIPSDPSLEFKDEQELFTSLPRAAAAIQAGAGALAAHAAKQLAR